MDLSQFQKVTRANTIKFPARQDFDIKFDSKTGRFKISEKIFEDLSLEDNSLIQYNNFNEPDKGVFLHVVPGNTGIFLKKHGSKSKGRAFKNNELEKALEELNMAVDEYVYYTVEYISMVNDSPMYKIVIDDERYKRLIAKEEEPESAPESDGTTSLTDITDAPLQSASDTTVDETSDEAAW